MNLLKIFCACFVWTYFADTCAHQLWEVALCIYRVLTAITYGYASPLRVPLGLCDRKAWPGPPACKWRRWLGLVNFTTKNGEVEEWGGKRFVQHDTGSPWQSRKENPGSAWTMQLQLAGTWRHLYSLAHSRVYFPGKSLHGPPPTHHQLIFSCEDKHMLDLSWNQRGGENRRELERRRGKELKEQVLQKLQKNLWPWDLWKGAASGWMMTVWN